MDPVAYGLAFGLLTLVVGLAIQKYREKEITVAGAVTFCFLGAAPVSGTLQFWDPIWLPNPAPIQVTETVRTTLAAAMIVLWGIWVSSLWQAWRKNEE